MAFGAPSANSYSGYVRVHRLIGESWLQLGTTIAGDSTRDSVGESVALSSDGLTVSMDTDHV